LLTRYVVAFDLFSLIEIVTSLHRLLRGAAGSEKDFDKQTNQKAAISKD